jgi:hypothetical protein
MWYHSSTMEATPCFASVRTTRVKAAQACAPDAFFEHCDPLRAITAGRSARGPIIRGRNLWIVQEPQPIAPVVVATNLVEQPLIVGIRQAPVA